ncbi:hypothetical protein [Chryseobacterium paridis]|nr:hypothetical protein [Chryseobacterium paridis]
MEYIQGEGGWGAFLSGVGCGYGLATAATGIGVGIAIVSCTAFFL